MTPKFGQSIRATGVAAIVLLGLSAPAHAEGSASTPPSEASVVVNDVAGNADPASKVSTSDGDLALSTPSVEVSADPGTGIAMDATGGASISIGIPGEDRSPGALLAGNVIYADVAEQTAIAARPVEGGAQALIVVEGPAAPSLFAFPITVDGAAARLQIRADGSVSVLDNDGSIVGTVQRPWAVDASQHTVPTRYELQNGTLMQVVDHAGAHYPVVADPKVTLGWKIYVKYSRSEVHSIASNPLTNKLKYTAAICAAIPNGVAGAACAFYVYDSYSSISNTFESADRNKRCVEMQYLYSGLLVGWKTYAC